MTTNQLNVILMTAKLGSISAAAKALGLSQPNASSCIKTAKEECGFEIFQRTRDGITTTTSGALFLEQAQKITDANDEIKKIKNNETSKQLRLGSDNFSLANNAFVKFCTHYNKEINVDFQQYKVSLERGIELLKLRRLDVLIALSFEEDNMLIKRMCKEAHIQHLNINKMPTAVCVRKGHPLLSQMSSLYFLNDADVLKPYNYVYYEHLNNENESAHTYKTVNVPHSGLILVPETDERLKIVSSSDAFSVGIQHTKEVLDRYNLAEIPIEDIQFNINCYFREAEADRDEIKEYRSLFEEEVKQRFR